MAVGYTTQKSLLWVIAGVFAIGALYTLVNKYGINKPEVGADGAKKIFVGFVAPTTTNPFFVSMRNGAELAAKNSGVKLEFQAPVAGVQDTAGQVDIIDNLIARGVDVLCVVPADSAAIVPGVETATQKSIPVLNIDNRIVLEPGSKAKVTAYIGSDNKLGGYLAGRYIAERLHGGGSVVEMDGLIGSDAAIQRATGFGKAMSESTGLTVVAKESASWNRELAANKFAALIQKQPKIDAVFAANDEMALGVIVAIQEANSAGVKLSPVVVGFDATGDGLAAIRSGNLAATVAQQPEEMGKLCVETAVRITRGEKVEVEIAVPVKLVTGNDRNNK